MISKKVIAEKGAAIHAGMAKLLHIEEQPAPAYEKPVRPSKRGTTLVTQHDPAVLKQLKLLAAEKDTTQQKLIARAINLLFKECGKKEIA